MIKYFRKYNYPSISVQQSSLYSQHLKRLVVLDTFAPRVPHSIQNQLPIIIFNDGQILHDMKIDKILRKLLMLKRIQPCIIIGIHSNQNRIQELGTTQYLHFDDLGISSQAYQAFITQELIPMLQANNTGRFYIAGCSLGGLSALDTTLNHPNTFSAVGIFSGALWWRDKPFAKKQPNANLIIPKKILALQKAPSTQFWFQAGTLDETTDRDNNGIIDVIDDTLSTIVALQSKGVSKRNIAYLEIKGGKHEPQTWAKAMPKFLMTVCGS